MPSSPYTDRQRAAILVELYNGASAQGMGVFHRTPGSMYFGYLQGRVLKVDMGADDLSFRLYNRDNGEGAGEAAEARALSNER